MAIIDRHLWLMLASSRDGDSRTCVHAHNAKLTHACQFISHVDFIADARRHRQMTEAETELALLLRKPAGTANIACEAWPALHAFLCINAGTAKMANDSSACFAVQMHTYASGHRVKTVMLCSRGKRVPVTKNMLRQLRCPAKPSYGDAVAEAQQMRSRVCSACGNDFEQMRQARGRKCGDCIAKRSIADAVRAAARRAVQEQLLAFRKKHKQKVIMLMANGLRAEAERLGKCVLTGQPLSTCKTAVDHREPFVDLWLDFICGSQSPCNCGAFAVRGICEAEANVRLHGRGNNKSLADDSLRERWQTYHAEHAVLQMTCSRANSAKGASKPATKS